MDFDFSNSDDLTLQELKNIIRKILKDNGYSNRKVSVSHIFYGSITEIRFIIKSDDVNIDLIRELARKVSHIWYGTYASIFEKYFDDSLRKINYNN